MKAAETGPVCPVPPMNRGTSCPGVSPRAKPTSVSQQENVSGCRSSSLASTHTGRNVHPKQYTWRRKGRGRQLLLLTWAPHHTHPPGAAATPAHAVAHTRAAAHAGTYTVSPLHTQAASCAHTHTGSPAHGVTHEAQACVGAGGNACAATTALGRWQRRHPSPHATTQRAARQDNPAQATPLLEAGARRACAPEPWPRSDGMWPV